MSRIRWRWEERDFGFRFRTGKGARAAEYYQAREPGSFYVVPAAHRKLDKDRVEDLDGPLGRRPAGPKVVANPWENYDLENWDFITTADGLCLNWAGCLDREEIDRREDEGVQRALEFIAELAQRPEPVPLTVARIQQIHIELMGAIYPFAGFWRSVGLHKGDGPEKWPLPPAGIQKLMDVLEREVLSRSPFLSGDDGEVFAYASEVMNELLAIHPFREGNGRTAFMVGNLILMQNSLLPLTVYERHEDQSGYYAACEAGRLHRDYAPLAALLAEWEDRAVARWEAQHG